MRRITFGYKGVFAVYVCLLVVLGSYLILNNQFLLNNNTPYELPLDFLLRFGIFWFLSFVLALLFFIAHIHMNEYSFSETEVTRSAKVGLIMFMSGVLFAALSGTVIFSLS